MKQNIIILVLVIIISVLGYDAYQNSGLQLAVSSATETAKKVNQRLAKLQGDYDKLGDDYTIQSKAYNQATIKLNSTTIAKSKAEFAKDSLDKKLKLSRREIRNLTEKIRIQAIIIANGKATGETTANTNMFGEIKSYTAKFNDFRINGEATVYTDINKNAEVDYTLNQEYAVHIDVIDNIDYRVQLAEINRATGEVVATYPVSAQVEHARSKVKWNIGFNLMMGASVGLDNRFTFLPQGYLAGNWLSRGATHLDSDWRLLSLYIGTASAGVIPFSWRASNIIPFFSDLFLDFQFGSTYKGNYYFGTGLSSTF